MIIARDDRCCLDVVEAVVSNGSGPIRQPGLVRAAGVRGDSARSRGGLNSLGFMRYFANLARKVETIKAGPPAWRPCKPPSQKGMSLEERTIPLQDSIAEDPAAPMSRRFAVRRTASGLEFFTAQVTQVVNGECEYHGYPTRQVPGRILRQFMSMGIISRLEYRRLVKRLG